MNGLFSRPPYPPRGGLLSAFEKGTKRKAFFSFHYDDVMRVNNVRNAFKIYNPTSILAPTFYDSSLWESRKMEGEESLKRLIREVVEHTSVVCVLVGTETWQRPWVRYEIARSVIDKRGLLAVHINGLAHHQRRTADVRGLNPLNFMAVGLMHDATYRLFENINGSWCRYERHTPAVDLPKYLSPPKVGFVTPLNEGTMEYDFVAQKGHENIDGWIDLAAKLAGR